MAPLLTIVKAENRLGVHKQEENQTHCDTFTQGNTTIQQ